MINTHREYIRRTLGTGGDSRDNGPKTRVLSFDWDRWATKLEHREAHPAAKKDVVPVRKGPPPDVDALLGRFVPPDELTAMDRRVIESMRTGDYVTGDKLLRLLQPSPSPAYQDHVQYVEAMRRRIDGGRVGLEPQAPTDTAMAVRGDEGPTAVERAAAWRAEWKGAGYPPRVRPCETDTHETGADDE